ncbi:hypothetical protein B0H12DRAFT_668150 [Mycena haematopus]|nr:hypothetical protein B0H12DRAFT_668150 [Mycena haematopus]
MAYDRTRASHIHTKIQTLRGEYFRHIQNQGILPRNFKTAQLGHNSPTLPADLYTDSAYSNEKPRPTPPRDTREALFVPKRVERPQPDLTSTATWRAEALSLIVPAIAECHKVPPLTLLCLQILVAPSFDADFAETMQFIPPHLRLVLLRWAAVHRPLTNHKLRALCSDGPVAGELIVVGPDASVHEDQFKGPDAECRSAEWDSDDWPPPIAMHTFILLSVHLTSSIVFNLPATLTHLALVHILNPVSLHRLPTTCPLLECLDLSYNAWLVAEKDAQERLGKLQWSRWHHLRTLGLRGCHVPSDLMVLVNRGRWDDVQVVKQ